MKKILALLLAGLTVLCLASCGDKEEEKDNNSKDTTQIEQNYVDEAAET